MLWRILDRIVAVAASIFLLVIWNHEPTFRNIESDFDWGFRVCATALLFLYPLAPLIGICRSVPSAFWAWCFGLPVLCGMALLYFPHEYGSKIYTARELVRLYLTVGGYSFIRMIVTWNEEGPIRTNSPDAEDGEAGQLLPQFPAPARVTRNRVCAAVVAGLLLFAVGSLRAQTVCIDPGHPSEVGIGTQGKHSTEVGVAWQIAKALQIRLRREGIDVFLTKGSERERVTNRRRAEISNEANSNLMIRLHCDAGNSSGFAVYYPAKAGTVDGVTGPSGEVIRRSHAAAEAVHREMAKLLKGALRDNGLKTDSQTAVGSRQGALTGSIYSKVPAVLVEMVVLTNRKDEAFILSKKGRDLMVEALARGVLAATRLSK